MGEGDVGAGAVAGEGTGTGTGAGAGRAAGKTGAGDSNPGGEALGMGRPGRGMAIRGAGAGGEAGGDEEEVGGDEEGQALAERLAIRAKSLANILQKPMWMLATGDQWANVQWSVRLKEWAQALGELVGAPLVTYDEIVANSTLMDIIYSIEPDHRLHLAHHLWEQRQKYWWLIQIIAPITRLPLELLQQVLLIIIDEASDSPLYLMQVSTLWCTTINGIWASLKLGQRRQRILSHASWKEINGFWM